MSGTVVVYKNRTNVLRVALNKDVSLDTLTSEIRTEAGELIVAWTVTVEGDAEDGNIILTLEADDLSAITQVRGVMDIKRVSGGKPFAVFDYPLEVEFRNTVTV